MMIYESRQVLRGLKALTKNTNQVISYLGNTTCFCLLSDTNQTYDYGKYAGAIRSIMWELEAEGVIKTVVPESQYVLTNHGMYSLRYDMLELKDYILHYWIDIAALTLSIIALILSLV